MDMEKVFSLFRLFYNEEDAESFLPVAEVAATLVCIFLRRRRPFAALLK